MFITVLVLMRILGKRQPSKTTPFGFVVYVVIAITAALVSANIIRIVPFGLLILAVWGLTPIGLDFLAMKSKRFHDILLGKETILIKQGKIMEEHLMQVRMSGEELLRELRSKNVFNLADVEFAVMETTGDLNVMVKSDKKPLTARDLGERVGPQAEPQTVIMDGNIMDEPLTAQGLNRQWLKTQLDRKGISVDNVFIGQIDSSGDLYVDLFDDAIQLPESKTKEILFASLEKAHADLMGYALETEDMQARAMYETNAERLRRVITGLEPHLLR